MRARRLPLLLVAAVAVVAAIALLRGGDGPTLEAEFRDAAGLRPASPVRVGGARVGVVDDIRITDRDTALVRIDLDHELLLGQDARARVRPANLLGEKFVELEVGDRARPLRGGRIPLQRTATPVELDDVLDVLDPTTRGRLAVLLGSLGIAVDGQGEELRAALKVLPGTVEDAGELAGQLAADSGSLERLLAATDHVTGSLAGQRRALGELVASADRALDAPARQRAGLQRLLAAAPPALRQLRTSLARIDRTGAALRPAATGLRATATPLRQALEALPAFQRTATPALRELRRTAPSLTLLGREGAPVLDRARPPLDQLAGLGRDGDRLFAALDEHAADLLGFTENWARTTQSRDATGHVFRVSIHVQLEAIKALLGANTPPTERRGDRRQARSAARAASAAARRSAAPAASDGARPSAPAGPAAAPTTTTAPATPAASQAPHAAAPVAQPLAAVGEAASTLLDRLLGR